MSQFTGQLAFPNGTREESCFTFYLESMGAEFAEEADVFADVGGGAHGEVFGEPGVGEGLKRVMSEGPVAQRSWSGGVVMA